MEAVGFWGGAYEDIIQETENQALNLEMEFGAGSLDQSPPGERAQKLAENMEG